RVRDWDGRHIDINHDGRFRSAANAVEEHAARAVIQLSDNDPDMAGVQNKVGWNGMDSRMGHSFAEALRTHGRLSDKQWEIACKMVRKYWKQVGRAPSLQKRDA